MSGLMRGGAAIVGAAESDLGQVGEGFNVIDLMAQGIVRALDFFPLYENALRARDGASLADGQAESARMWA